MKLLQIIAGILLFSMLSSENFTLNFLAILIIALAIVISRVY